MTPDLLVVWSGATERAGQAKFALSSPLIGSSARLCMEVGGHANSEGPRLQDKPLPRRRCRTCFAWFVPPVELRRLKNATHCHTCTERDWSGTK